MTIHKTALSPLIYDSSLRADVRAAVRLSDADFHAADLARARRESIRAVLTEPRDDRQEAIAAARGMANVTGDFVSVIFDGSRYFIADEDDRETYHRAALDAQTSAIVYVAEPRQAAV